MSAHPILGPLAFGGGPLEGSKLVRFLYLDEGGISNAPFAVVAGPFVHGDTQAMPLQQHIATIIARHIPEEDWPIFPGFHMKDLWWNYKYFVDKEKWPWERRAPIIDDLVALPERLGLTIVFGFFDRENDSLLEFPSDKPPTRHELSVAAHSIAHASCVLAAERMMREVYPEENAQIVAENNNEAKATIDACNALFRNPLELKRQGFDTEYLPLRRFLHNVLWASKSECGCQVADTCAFVIRRRLERRAGIERFFDPLKRRMLVLPKGEPQPVEWDAFSSWPFGPLDLSRNSAA